MLTNLVQLRTFVAVAEDQHFTRAAERLHVSRSAASVHLRSIEDSLDPHAGPVSSVCDRPEALFSTLPHWAASCSGPMPE